MIKAVSGIVIIVKDPDVSANFYENLGFIVTKRESGFSSVRSNWFWIDFVRANRLRNTGNDNQYIYLSVDDIDDTYEKLKANKLHPTKPEDFNATGRRETMISDPDGYKLVFFKKK
jgi:catechol 2,3-dioxygenase-like lactoylglutathione lyase family enzyme